MSTQQPTELSDISRIVAMTSVKTPRSMAQWSTINKEMRSLLQLKGLTTKQLICQVREYMIKLKIRRIEMMFKIRESLTSELPCCNNQTMRILLNRNEIEDNTYFIMSLRNHVDYVCRNGKQVDIEKESDRRSVRMIQKKVMKHIPISKNTSFTNTGSSCYIKIDNDDDIQSMDYIIKRWMDVSSKPFIFVVTNEDHYENTDICLESVVKLWYPYQNDFLSDDLHKTRILYDGKIINVYRDSNAEKCIILDRQRVLLSSIRGKYRYIK